MKNKEFKKIIIFISIVLGLLIIVMMFLLRDIPKEGFSVRKAHDELIEESQEQYKKNNRVSEMVSVDSSDMETHTVSKDIQPSQAEDTSEYLGNMVNDMKEKTKGIDFSSYTPIEDTTDYSKFGNVNDLISRGEHFVKYTQQFYFTEIANTDYESLRLSFHWIDLRQKLNEYHLYNEDMTLEYLPVEEKPGEIVYIIENVADGEKFKFYLDAYYLSGVSFTQEEQATIDSMQFETEEDILNYYGDWILEGIEYE